MNIRTGAAAVILSALLALTGCAGPGENPAASSGNGPGSVLSPASEVVGEAPHQSGSDQPTAADAAPRGFEFASGFLEFGDFDPYTLGDDIFNPCTEITEQEFAAAGFDNKRGQTEPDALNRGMTSCYFGERRPDGVTRGFSNGTLSRNIANERNLVMDPHPSELLPEMYVLRPRGDNEGICFTQIDTKRGGFGTQAGGSPIRISTNEACSIAIADLESLYEVYGK